MEKIKKLVSIIFVFMFFVSGSAFAEDKIRVLLSDELVKNITVKRAKDVEVQISFSDELSGLHEYTIKEIVQKLLIEKQPFYYKERLNTLSSLLPLRINREYSYKIFLDQEKNLVYGEKILNDSITASNILRCYITMLLSLLFLVLPMIFKIIIHFYSENEEKLSLLFFLLFLTMFVIQLCMVGEFIMILFLAQILLIGASVYINGVILEKISISKFPAIIVSAFLMTVSGLAEIVVLVNIQISQLINLLFVPYSIYLFITCILFFIVYFLEKRKTQTLECDFQFDNK